MSPELPKKEKYIEILREFLGNMGAFLHLRKIYLQQIRENIEKEQILEKEVRRAPYTNIVEEINLMKFKNPWLRIVEDYFIKIKERYEKFTEDIKSENLTREEIKKLKGEYKKDMEKLENELKEKLKNELKELNEDSIVKIVNLIKEKAIFKY
jgi:type II secretory ATPase GspE/PulE/Tfp pilus assembly ATPase PilB-like protein